jgi:hypothetical protein
LVLRPSVGEEDENPQPLPLDLDAEETPPRKTSRIAEVLEKMRKKEKPSSLRNMRGDRK